MPPTLEETKDGRGGLSYGGNGIDKSLSRTFQHAELAREPSFRDIPRRSSNSSSYSPSVPSGGTSVVTQVTVDADARERILQGQRDAALRRRKQQFQSGFISTVNAHVGRPGSRGSSMPDPRLGLGPTIQNFSRPVDVRSTRYVEGFGREVSTPYTEMVDPRSANEYNQRQYHHLSSRDSFHMNHPVSHERAVFDYDAPASSFNGMPTNGIIGPATVKHSIRPSSSQMSQREEIIQMDFDRDRNGVPIDMEQQTYRPALSPVSNFRSNEGGYEDHDDAMSDLTEQRTYDGRCRIGYHNSNISRVSGKIIRSPSRLSNMVESVVQRPGQSEFTSEQSRLSITDETPSLENTSATDSRQDAEEVNELETDGKEEAEEMAIINTIMDKKDAKADTVQKFLDSIDWDNQKEVKKFLMEPVPKSVGMLQCYMKRNKGKSKLHPEYRVYLRDNDRFLMSSKKRARKQVSNYLISTGRNDHHKGSDNIIGKLKANFIGTEFQIYDGGKNPRDHDPFFDEKNEDEVRSELGAILYSSNKWGSKGPRKMQVCINRVKEGGGYTKKWQPVHKDEEMLQCFKYKSDSALRHLLFFENRQPQWNEEMGAYVLNFNNRVKLASVKNFQLVEKDPDGDEKDKVTMQFGKNGKDEFVVDAQWPMSIFQAFSIALSSCDSKIACD